MARDILLSHIFETKRLPAGRGLAVKYRRPNAFIEIMAQKDPLADAILHAHAVIEVKCVAHCELPKCNFLAGW